MTPEFLLILILILVLAQLLYTLLVFHRQTRNRIQDALGRYLPDHFTRLSTEIREELSRDRSENNRNFLDNRKELHQLFKSLEDTLMKRMNEIILTQRNQFNSFLNQTEKLTRSNEEKLDNMTGKIESKLSNIQKDNSEKLEKMRETVDEKLHKTLEERLGQSFKLVSDQLEVVSRGLGEMQTLAHGVGDLKKVLANVKTRGVMGEYQLENILEQLLSPGQYEKNVKPDPQSDQMVEFAIKLPGKNEKDKSIWLPIDAKFPISSYEELRAAYDQTSSELIGECKKEFFRALKKSAKDIRDKYIRPPHTTDFAIMFLPVEGLYAEVLKETSVFEELQHDYRVTVTGPTTLSALLSSLQMGFRTLAIEKRSSEVWELLGTVKAEFGQFGKVLDKTKKKLGEASHAIDQAGVRTRAIARSLRDVEELPRRRKKDDKNSE
jgi:DNA recombination protein RmuC